MSLEGTASTPSTLRGKINTLDTKVINAYDLAVKNGFKGTEAEWLASLNGEPGVPGQSSYEIALKHGFKGTEAEWLASLNGEPGVVDENGYVLKDQTTGKKYKLYVSDGKLRMAESEDQQCL